ncbi:syntaxin-binding protein 5 isoform X1 [Drosophila albomicans]|uniref:Syntaxin-binding protein 5 isoform X1 n=1 Tax=Drosophila albomicans TaxID=7291 RepID=A0A6P8X1Y6_DROAB|nr:syntaxin-binding protein 5 isoform X1 [Drosophila albomicans]XP_051864560.1 syntaxin-binding protein 5 isoform X1 [Drosophila albomicans]XP_051864561.1 syntaxin-binding protein 5 isoform X1 [Drosophila albomicans]XP_051864562.1 syntaxin-binding protein 5 isoform X1 [Drosophila albomicans]XP_051864563.1 syntaxin-binding protein 5 isoform X1 [Drosophila albomicans]
MKKFTFKGVLDGFRQTVQPQAIRQEQEIQEQLKADHFTLKKTFRHGFPFSPTSFAFDPVQKLLAIGDKSGYIRILGRPGVDAHAKHEGESECAVLFAQFLVNEGALVTVTADDTIHLWNIRQKTPRIVQSLKFQRERVTCIHLPVGSKWLYVGTEKGNIHVVHIDTFALSGYIINWNKAIEVVRTSHPGAVIALCDNPLDANKLLIAFECGLLVLWDLKAKCAEIRWQAAEAVKSLAWHYEGKYFVSSHTDGSICSWPTKPQPKPQSQVCPHAKINKDGNAEKCKPIYKVDLKSSTTGETFTIFSGGMPSEKGSKSNCITVMVGKTTTVLEMEHAVCDFITLCENPWPCETQEPYAIAVLLQYDLVLIDLLTPGFPCFESPYPMDLHESPVTCCTYLTDCPSDLVPAFYSVGRTTTSKKTGFSEREWPISGGEWSPASCSYSEIVITGHQDGSLKFWDSGAGTLQILYKLKTAKMFEKPRHVSHATDSDNPLAVHLIFLCSESRRLCVAGAMGQVMLFKFRKVESTSEVLVLEIPILYENFDDNYGTSPECDFLTGHQVQKTESSDSDKTECTLKVRFGAQRKPPGFQSQLVCLTTGPNRRTVQVTSLCINSSYGLMAYGTEYGLVIIDIIQKICLLSVACPDLYGAHDPYSRTPKSPKRIESKEEQSRSPSSDQLNDTTSPDSPSIEFIPEANEASVCGAAPGSGAAAADSSASASRPTSPLAIEQVINSSKEMLISGAQAQMGTAAALAATKSPQRDEAAATAPKAELQDRRKSMSWKTFNLKRQLSKVNMKIGGSLNQELEAIKSGSSSIFYATPKESSPEGASEEATPGEALECREDDVGLAAATAMLNCDTEAQQQQQQAAVTPTPTQKRVDFEQPPESGERPSNLPLSEQQQQQQQQQAPLKPTRQKFKEKARDQRLLSVPNIKYQPREQRAGLGIGISSAASGGSGSGGRVNKNDVSPMMSGSLSKKIHKLDGTFSRSRSSSMSSIDMSSSESVTCLAFIESYAKRNDILSLVPTLWIGTSFGSILTLFITMPERDMRKSQPVLVTINGGPVVRLKGSITSMSFLDSYGSIIPYTFEPWRDENRDKKDRTPTKSSSRTSPTFTPTTANTISNTSVAGGAGAAGGGAAGSAGAGGGGASGGSGGATGAAAGSGGGGGGGSSAGGISGGGGGISSSSASSSGISGSVSTGLETLTDRQYIVIASEKQTKVFDVANQCCINRIQLSEMDFAVKAETITMKDGSCLATYLSNGHLMVHSLPSLKLLLDTDFLPLMDLSFQTKCKQGIVDPMLSIWGQQIIVHEDTTQISKIFCFSHKGHGLYMASPTEIQKFTISSEFCQFILEMMGELYTVHEMPEQPKEGFFKGLFGGGAKLLDREELFGEQSGKANRSVARHIPGPNLEQLGQRASTAASEISRAHQLAMERGEKLNLLEERAERMANTAQDFSGTAHQLMLKYKDKKWYQL